MEDSKIVKSLEVKDGTKGPYCVITWQDDKTDRIFNQDWMPLLRQSEKEHRLLHFTKEKKGTFWNIVTLEMANLDKPPVKVESPNTPDISHGTKPAIPIGGKGTLASEVAKLNTDSKERSMAMSYSKDLVTNGIVGIADLEKLADRIFKWIKGD